MCKGEFFKLGMNDTEVQLGSHRFEALRAQLPAAARGGEREKLRALLEKFPPELAKRASKYRRAMCRAEVTKKAYDWSYEELTAILSSDMAGARPAVEVNAAEPRGGGGNALFTMKFNGCLHCGLDGHYTRECAEPPCEYCGFRFCFGVRKKGPMAARSCLVKRVVQGGKITDADVGYNGKPLPARLVEQLNDKAAKLKTGGGETNTTEVQTERNVLDDYDEVAGGESD